MPKICIIAHLNDLSGANKSLIDLAKGLSINNEITVVVPRKGPLFDELRKNHINEKVILSGTWVYKKDESLIKKIIKRILNVFAEVKYYSFFKANNFDLIHYNSYTYGTGAVSAKKLNIPYTWHIRELPEENFNLSFFNKKKSVRIISKSKCIITISKFMKQTLIDTFESKKIKVIYNGVVPISDKLPEIPCDCFSDIVIIGAIAEDKGQLDAIRAIRYLHEMGHKFRLFIVGSVTDNEYYEKIKAEIIEDIDSSIIFTGYKSNLKDYRKNTQIVLICSKAEAFGRVTIEAMNAGQIVIGADKGATPEIIKDGYNGFLYKQGDYIDLANRIKDVCYSADLNKISYNARETVNSCFSIKRTVNEVEKIMHFIIESRTKNDHRF